MSNPATGNQPDGATLVEIWKRAVLIMRNDEKLRRAIRTGRLVTPYYSPRGQEVISAAYAANLSDEDYIVTIYRGVHDQLAKGLPLKVLWAEYAGHHLPGKGHNGHDRHRRLGNSDRQRAGARLVAEQGRKGHRHLLRRRRIEHRRVP
jgi:pyruvate dehydrogenase E1 component alpha subunit